MFQQEINCFRIQLVLVLFILIGGPLFSPPILNLGNRYAS